MKRSIYLFTAVVATAIGLALPAAAGAAALTTSYEGSNGNKGVSFDLNVLSLSGIRVNGLAVSLSTDPGLVGVVEVWTRSGTAAGTANDPAGWTLRGAPTTTSAGWGNPTPVPVELELAPGTHGFVVGNQDPDSQTSVAYGEGGATFSQAALELVSRSGLYRPFFTTSSDIGLTRVFNGTIDYDVLGPIIEGGPAGPTSDPQPTFEFVAGPPPVSYECRLYREGEPSPAFGPCSGPEGAHTPAEPLTAGSYVFQARSIDETPVTSLASTRTFTVESVPPVASITFGPSGTTTDRSPRFGFASSEAGSTFECRLFRTGSPPPGFRACSGPGETDASPAPLPLGAHSFQVRATDAAGNVGSPATRDFAVVAPPGDGLGGSPGLPPEGGSDAACAASVRGLSAARERRDSASRSLTKARRALKAKRRKASGKAVAKAKRKVKRAARRGKAAGRDLERALDEVVSTCP